MKKQFKLSVPEPCHEDWSTMTPKEKGRFCQSCSKTVVDFTQKSKEEIQQYLSDHFGKRVCGHFRREQLDTITLEIPTATFHQSLSYQKLFLLALLFVMGTTLFSCQNSNGTKQKIENVILIDSIPPITKEIDSLPTKECTQEKDTIEYMTLGKVPLIKRPPAPTPTTGIILTPTELNSTQKLAHDNMVNQEEVLDGELIVEVTGDLEPYEEEIEEWDVVLGYIIEEHPKFPQADSLSGEKAREDFNQRMRLFFQEHFKTPKNLGLQRKHYRIFTQFEIDTLGRITDIQIRTPHPTITQEVERVLKKLPTFIPGEQRGKRVSTRYTLPIRIDLDD
jgi:hypothetical protein